MSERTAAMRKEDDLTASGPRHVVTVACVVIAGDPGSAMEAVVKPLTRPALRSLVSVRSVKATRLDED